MSRFQFVADHRDAFEVKWLCGIVEVSRSSFYAWLDAAAARAERAAADAALAEQIRAVQAKEGIEYGAPRITAELNDGTNVGDDGRVNHKRVARVMRAHSIAGRIERAAAGRDLIMSAISRVGGADGHPAVFSIPPPGQDGQASRQAFPTTESIGAVGRHAMSTGRLLWSSSFNRSTRLMSNRRFALATPSEADTQRSRFIVGLSDDGNVPAAMSR